MDNNLNIRNFCIISHIDHGKSTLADRFLELTETVPKEKMRPQYLDAMDLEREKGITIKMQPVRINYTLNNVDFILNLIDTPGHADFSYEVSRSLAAVEGAILLVDVSKGIQAQTLANLELAKKQNLLIVPAINKIDLVAADSDKINETKKEMSHLLNVPDNGIFLISAKYGKNIEELLGVIIEKIPPPGGDPDKPFRALIFDSKYDPYKGVIAYVRVVDGEMKTGDKIFLIQNKTSSELKEIGYFKPELLPCEKLRAGEIGYIATGIKEPGKVRVGDTIVSLKSTSQGSRLPEPLPGYKEPKAVVFASIFPVDPNDFDLLKDGLDKLQLNDPSFNFEQESKEGLGRGYRCGFLGSLHAEIITERLKREFGLNLIISAPSVVYKIINKKEKEILISSPLDWPDYSLIKEAREPWVKLEIISPQTYLGNILGLLKKFGGEYIENRFLSENRIILTYEIPLREIIKDFYDRLKGVTQGFASMNYEVLDWRLANLVKLDILVAGKREEAFSKIVPEEKAYSEGREIVKKLKEALPPQLFSVPLQAAISGKIIARETLSSRRKDVIAPLYGGDYTRKKKLLEKQKKGKKRLKEKGKVRIPPNVFLELFKG